MDTRHRTALLAVAVLWLMSAPAAALGGYDVAHIVKHTCEPGGSLIVTDKWKLPQDRDRVVTEPGEVIACPTDVLQIAAGPDRIGGEAMLCTYFTLRGGDGADLCLDPGSVSSVRPLVAIQPDRSDRIELVGIAGAEVATVSAAGTTAELIPIERRRAARLGATRAFAYFSLTVDRRTFCADGALRLVGRDRAGRRIAASTVPARIAVLSAVDRLPHARFDLCDKPAARAWLTETAALVRRLLRSLI
jgi:hypothetical protein